MHNIRLFCGTQCSRRFILGASPELKFRITDEADTAYVVSGLPTARKPWYIFFSPFFFLCKRARSPILNQCRLHMLQTFSLLPIFRPVLVERCWQGENNVALINVAIYFGYEYFCFVIYFSNIFRQNFFFKFFFSKFFFQHFFSNIFFQLFVIELHSGILILTLILILKKICWKKFAIVSCSKRKI